MIILDYSQVALSNIFQFQTDLKKEANNPEAVNIIRHAILTGLKFYKKKFGQQYGDIILACDGKQYWRKDIFPYYKAGRSKARSQSDLDWKLIFDTISQIREDIAAHFPYKVIHLDHIEADDIVATICKWSQTNHLDDYFFFEQKQPIMIVSSDQDFHQLHCYENVKQYSPIQKKQSIGRNPKQELLKKIASGDRGDGIPNVLSVDNVLVTEGTRQTKLSKQRLEEFATLGRDACQNDVERRNWDRNNQLINLECIPVNISNQILEQYNQPAKGDKMSVFNYLMKHKCRLLLEEVSEF